MKNWQDYATDAKTNRSKLTHHQPTRSLPNTAPAKPLALKIWLVVNTILVICCVSALYYGINRTNAEHSGLIGLFRNTALTFYIPSLVITALLTNNASLWQAGNSSIFFWSYNILCLLLIMNLILAFIFYYRNKHQHWRTNLILATIPTAFVLIAFLVRYL